MKHERLNEMETAWKTSDEKPEVLLERLKGTCTEMQRENKQQKFNVTNLLSQSVRSGRTMSAGWLGS